MKKLLLITIMCLLSLTMSAQKLSLHHIVNEVQATESGIHALLKEALRTDTLTMANQKKVVCDMEMYFDYKTEKIKKAVIEFHYNNSSVLEEMYFKDDRLICVHINSYVDDNIVEIYFKDYRKMIFFLNGIETALKDSDKRNLANDITQHIYFLENTFSNTPVSE